jgi:hypothetical protein
MSTLVLVLLALVGVGSAPPLTIGSSRLGWSALSEEQPSYAVAAVRPDPVAAQLFADGGALQRQALPPRLVRSPLVCCLTCTGRSRWLREAHRWSACPGTVAPLPSLHPSMGRAAASSNDCCAHDRANLIRLAVGRGVAPDREEEGLDERPEPLSSVPQAASALPHESDGGGAAPAQLRLLQQAID